MKFFVLFAIVALSGVSKAQIPSGTLLKQGQVAVGLEEALAGVKPGSVVVLGEEHDTDWAQNYQMQVLEFLRKKGFLVSVGMEFFTYLNQPEVDQWRAGQITEADFLKKIRWGSFSFEHYRSQVQFPMWGSEYVIALNAPQFITSKIAKSGLASLSESERAILPADFTVGNDLYRERFYAEMGGHLPNPNVADNYFTAQSAWDDTMALKAADFIRSYPEQVLVIIVGEFHVRYGGGLPDRLRARGVSEIVTFSLLNLQGMTELEEKQSLLPSPKYGSRADYIWVSRF